MERILSRHDVRGEARRRILEVVNILTLAKSQLQGHLSDRKAEIQRLTGELQTARTKNSEDGIIQLYNAGAKLIEQQAGEIKGLKADLQRAKDALDKVGDETTRWSFPMFPHESFAPTMLWCAPSAMRTSEVRSIPAVTPGKL